METLITDFEKTVALGAKMLEETRQIRALLTKDDIPIDMWGDDPGGVYGIVGDLIGAAAAPIHRSWNGPYQIETITASWVTTSVTSVTLQIGPDFIMPFPPATGFINLQGLKFQVYRDDVIIFTVAPKQPCSIRINGSADPRKRDYL